MSFFPSAGSFYFITEMTVGKKTGFVSGWLIIFAYLMLGISCAGVGSVYISELVGQIISSKIILIFLLLIIWVLAGKSAELNMRLLLTLEAVSIGLILVLSFVILSKAAETNGLSVVPFQTGENDLASLSYSGIFAILAFAGFEGASSLGEESRNPQKTIPMAITIAVILAGILYIFVSYAQMIGFGITAAGNKALAGSSMPLVDLASTYMGNKFGSVILFCFCASFFSASLGCISAGARILFAMNRDRKVLRMLPDKRNEAYGTFVSVYIAAALIIVISCSGLITIRLAQYAAIIGTLALLISYMITTFGACLFFYRQKIWKGPKLIIPILSIIVLAFIFAANVFPVPKYPMNLFPYLVIGWIVLGIWISRRKNHA